MTAISFIKQAATIVRALLLFGVLVVSCLVVFYLSWPLWSGWAAARLLAGQGIELRSAEIGRPGLRGVQISDLELVYQEAGLSLFTPELELSYQLTELWHGRLAQVRAKTLQLQWQAAESNDEAATALPPSSLGPLPLPLPAQLFAASPIAKLDIEQLQLGLRLSAANPGLRTWQLAGALHMDEQLLQLRLAQDDLQMQLDAQRDNSIELLIAYNQAPLISLTSALTADARGQNIHGNLAADLTRISDFLSAQGELLPAPYVTWLDTYQPRGQTRISWSFPLPESMDASSLNALEVEGELELEQLALDTRLNTTEAATLSLTLTSQYLYRSQQLDLTALNLELTGQWPLPAELQAWFETPLPEAMPFRLETNANRLSYLFAEGKLQLGEEPLRFNASAAEQRIEALLRNASLRWQSAGEPEIAGDFSLSLQAAGLQTPSEASGAAPARVSAGTASFFTEGKFRRDAAALNLDLTDQLQLELRRAAGPEWQAQKLLLRSATPVRLSWQPGAQALHNPALSLALHGEGLRWRDIELQPIQVELDLGNSRFELAQPQASASSLKLRLDGLQPPPLADLQLRPLDLHAELSLAEGLVAAVAELEDQAQLLRLELELGHRLTSGVGSLSLRVPRVRFSEDNSFLPRLFENWHQPFDLTGGTAAVQAQLNWRRAEADGTAQPLAGTATIDLARLGGFYERILFQGLDAKLQVAGWPDRLSWTAAEGVTLARIDAGFPIEGLEFELDADAALIQIRNLSAALFGGQVKATRIEIKPEAEFHDFSLNLEQLSLAAILELQSGIEGSGSLDGRLPLRWSAAGIRVEDGELNARPQGGTIRYQSQFPANSVLGNPNLKIALDALENFHYNKLDIRVDYDEDGELALAVALAGRNPNQELARPVNFNLNINQNLPTLLRSLQLTQNISDNIDRRVRALYQQEQD